MFCNFCDSHKFFNDHVLYKQKVCRICMINAFEKVQEEKKEWCNSVKIILRKKLINNEPKLADNIIQFIYAENEICSKNHICLYCNDYLNLMDGLIHNYYYFICGNCLNN